jgi:enoyl-CoA hydratase/carnithine racemase
LWQLFLGSKRARYLLMSGRLVDGKAAAAMGLVSISVPREQVEEEVKALAEEIAEIPRDGALHNKIAMNTDLKILGVDALFDYYAQMNRYTRFINKA